MRGLRGIGINGLINSIACPGGEYEIDPASIDGLQLWYDADDSTTLFQDSALTTPAVSDADPVGGWADKSGNGKTATQATDGKRPLLKLNIRNGLPVVRFDGTDDMMQFSIVTLTDLTIYVAFRGTYSAGDGTSWILAGAQQGIFDPGQGFGIKYSTQNRMSHQPNTTTGGTFSVRTWQNSKLYHNGCETLYINTGTITDCAISTICRDSLYNWDYYNADIGEILVYNTQHDSATRERIERYLGRKWGVQVLGMPYTLPTPGPGLILTFDDAEKSIFYGFRYMQARGLKATIYVVTDWISTGIYMIPEQLQIMDAGGWLMGNHTKSHQQLALLTLEQQEAQMSEAETALAGWSVTAGVKHLAFPFGSNNANTQTAMTNTGMLTGRHATVTGNIDPTTIDPKLFGLTYYVYNTATLNDLTSAVAGAIADGKYCVMLSHGIGSAVNHFATMALFESFVDWLVDNNIPCLTVADLYALT